MSAADAPPARPLLEGFTVQRTLSQRLTVHEPTYFIAGAEAPEVKFQLSFKYRLATLHDAPEGNSSHTLQFAYTQRSLWDIGAQSSPFYDTSYMPELTYQWVAATTARSTGGLALLGLQSGLRHESNGQADAASRSLNNLYLRTAVGIGASDGWHMLVVPEAYGYIGVGSENADLPQYRGYFTLRARVGRADREALLLTLVPGHDFSRGSRQLDFSTPVRIASVDFGAYLLVQYYDGYGESLRAYNERSSALRIGFALVR